MGAGIILSRSVGWLQLTNVCALVAQDTANVSASGTSFVGNSAVLTGGAVAINGIAFLNSVSAFSLTFSAVTRNLATRGGAIAIVGDVHAAISDTSIIGTCRHACS